MGSEPAQEVFVLCLNVFYLENIRKQDFKRVFATKCYKGKNFLNRVHCNQVYLLNLSETSFGKMVH